MATAPQPSYAGLFRCIGPQCEDTCCGKWDIPVDKLTYREYRRFPAEKLGSLVARFVREVSNKPHDNIHALITREPDGSCPFFGPDRLCAIQKEYGPGLLSATCSIYPRSLAVVNDTLEGSLSLSCPEAARMVLLREGSTGETSNLLAGEFRTDNVFRVRERPGLDGMFLPVRALVTTLIRDRSRALWQRLLLVASFCGALDACSGDGAAVATQLLARYENVLGLGLLPEFDRLAPQPAVRLELAIRLSDRRCRDRDCGQRFRDVFWDFAEGIGSMGGGDADDDVRRFHEAGAMYLAPLLDRSPHILENYLLNYVYQHAFPFGLAGERFAERSLSDEALLLVALFSWWTTLLTGVAGRYGPDFSEAQVITVAQSFTRAVEHAPQMQEDVLAFARQRGLHTAAGLAALLRA